MTRLLILDLRSACILVGFLSGFTLLQLKNINNDIKNTIKDQYVIVASRATARFLSEMCGHFATSRGKKRQVPKHLPFSKYAI